MFATELLTKILAFYLAVLALEILVLRAKQLTLSHALFFSLGIYGYSILSSSQFQHVSVFPFLALAFLSLVALTTLVTMRMRGDAFVLVSIALLLVIHSVVVNWYDVDASPGGIQNLLNGSYGLPIKIAYFDELHLAVLVITVVAIVLIEYFKRSHEMLVIDAIGSDELAARSLGLNPSLHRSIVQVLTYASLVVAGLCFASQSSRAMPDLISLDLSASILAMLLLGGQQLTNRLYAISFVFLLPFIIRLIPLIESHPTEITLSILGGCFILYSHLQRT